MRLRRSTVAVLGLSLALVFGIHTAGTAKSKECTGADRACLIAAASTYLDALVSHDASKVRLAPNAQRTENGDNTGNGAAEIREGLEAPIMDVITGMRDVRWFVDERTGNATAFYLLDTATPMSSSPHTTTEHIAERFKVQRGLITQIEAIFWLSPGAEPERSGW